MDGNRKKAIFSLSKKEYMDNVRSKWVIVLSILFVALILLISAYGGTQSRREGGIKGFEFTINFASSIVVLLLSIVAIIMGYKTIVDEVESKSVGLLLTSELCRRDVIIGKFLGLASVLATSIVAGLGVGGIVIGILSGFQNVAIYGKFIGLSILFSLTYLSISMMMSAIVNKTSRALAGGVFIWIFFNIVWDLITFGVLAATEGVPTSADFTTPDWYRYVTSINPNTSFSLALNNLLDEISLPPLLNIWTFVGILVLWTVIPIIIAFMIFNRQDL